MTEDYVGQQHTHGSEFAGMHRHDGEDPHWHDEFGEHFEPMSDDEAAALEQYIWQTDNIALTTVGVDIGSSTSHLMFSRVHLQRIGQNLATRFVVVSRQTLYKSPILLTPFTRENTIDAEYLRQFVRDAYQEAGLAREDIDTGAVILTGEALKRTNARAIADLFAEESGKFVCASAGHHLEALLAANGSGTVNRSRRDRQTLLNVDIGGGTTKLALVQDGEILATAAVAVGGRLLVKDAEGRLVRITDPARQVAAHLGVTLTLGEPLGAEDEQRMVRTWVGVLTGLIRREPPTGLAAELMLTDPLPTGIEPQAVTFSGGVSEFLYFRERGNYGDMGGAIARELRAAARDNGPLVDLPIVDPGQGIRATAIGASQFTVQVSGTTIGITNEAILPLHNLPVLFPTIELGDEIDPAEVAAAIRAAATRLDLEEGEAPLALAFRWSGDPAYRRVRALVDGICAGIPRTIAAGVPIAVLTDADIGKSLGAIMKQELAVPGEVLSIDGVLLQEFDFVDIGEVIRPAGAVPIVVKSLLFAGRMDRASVKRALLAAAKSLA